MEQTLEEQPSVFPGLRDRLCRITFSLILISLIYSFYSHTLTSQLLKPVLIFPSNDLTYWVIHLTRLPAIITGHLAIAVAFDLILFLSCVWCILHPQRRVWPVLFFIFYLLYFVIFNSYGLFHAHKRVGVLLLPIPFMMAGDRSFLLIWKGLRYYVCYIYGTAFLWKLFRGSGFYGQQAVLIIKRNLTAYLYYDPGSLLSKIYSWMILHPQVPALLSAAGFMLEGLFIIGFFTRRMDRGLFLLSIILPLGFLFMADTLFLELIFLAICFYDLPAGKQVRR
ncbi:MAG TPA: hypothetical protein VGM24_02065 [Puia sp.]